MFQAEGTAYAKEVVSQSDTFCSDSSEAWGCSERPSRWPIGNSLLRYCEPPKSEPRRKEWACASEVSLLDAPGG